MSIISASDFSEGRASIPNWSDPVTAANIDQFVTDYEPELLTLLLGADLYAQLLSGLALDPIPAKWVALRDKVKPSIIPYVYWYYRRDAISSFAGVGGEVIPSNENATLGSPVIKMIDRWNEMVKNNHEVATFIGANTADYGAYYMPSWIAYIGTIYGFGEVLYCTIPDIFKRQNRLGL